MRQEPLELHVYPLASGDLGVYQTLAVMRQLARTASATFAVRALAVQWTAGARTPFDRAVALRSQLARVYRYAEDLSVETLYPPLVLVAELHESGEITGDCDDLATLGAALGLAVGLTPTFVVVSEDPDAPFSHVFTVLAPSALVDMVAGPAVDLDLGRPARAVQFARVDAVRV